MKKKEEKNNSRLNKDAIYLVRFLSTIKLRRKHFENNEKEKNT